MNGQRIVTVIMEDGENDVVGDFFATNNSQVGVEVYYRFY